MARGSEPTEGGHVPATALAERHAPVTQTTRRRGSRLKVVGDDQALVRFAPCRSLGHSWNHVGFASADQRAPFNEANAVGYVSTCASCGAERIRWIGRSGTALPSRYRYTEGYSRRGEEALSLKEWRQVWLRALGVAS